MSKPPDKSRPSVAKLSIRWQVMAGAILIVLTTCLAYIPAMNAGFVWDDDDYVTKNQLLIAPDGLKRIWFSLDSPSQYFPLVYTTFRVEHAIWGFNPRGYHVVNIILHVMNALLLWVVLTRLGIRGAWFGAILWALHPVNVESVAWITERKNTLSTLLYLVSILAWMRFIEGRGKGDWAFYGLSLALFQLALFAKTTVCSLPAVLLLILWVKNKKIDWCRLGHIVPYLILGIGMGVVSIWWERHRQGTWGSEFSFSVIERILIASRALWFYVGKLIWPSKLVFSYPKWRINPDDPWQYSWLVGCFLVGLILWLRRGKISKPTIAALIFFAVSLAPTLGFISLYTFRYTFVADHYQYVASMGLVALFGGAIAMARGRGQVPLRLGMIVLVLVYGVLTWKQASAYKDAETLWRDAISKNPRCAIAHNNLANILDRKGKTDDAMVHYYRAIEIDPSLAEVHLNLAIALTERQRYEEAADECKKTIELCPEFPEAHYRLGVALARQNKNAEALQAYAYAIRLKPDYAEAYNGMGVALVSLGRLDDAIACLSRALEIKTDYADAHNNIAAAFYFRKQFDQAWRHIQLCKQYGGRPHPGLIQALSIYK